MNTIKNLHSLLAISLYTGLVLFNTACESNSTPGNEKPKQTSQPESIIRVTHEQWSAMDFSLAPLRQRTFSEAIYVNGTVGLRPNDREMVNTFFPGGVKSVAVLPGQKVAKGQVLFRLQNPQYVDLQKDYAQASNKMEYLRAEWQRQKVLYEDSISSQRQFLEAKSNFYSMRSRQAALQQKLRLMGLDPARVASGDLTTDILIRAGISGTVTKVNIQKGQFLSSQQTALEIIDNQALHLKFNVFEKDLPKINVGQKIRFAMPGDSIAQHRAEVYLISPSIDEKQRTATVHAHFQKAPENLFPGQYIRATVVSQPHSSPSLPLTAVVKKGQHHYGLLKISAPNDTAYRFRQVVLKVGERNDGFVAIKNAQSLPANPTFLYPAFSLIK